MPRRNEEPEWDSDDSSEEESGSEESDFENEGSESESGSEEDSEEGSEGSSEEESESEDDSESGSDDASSEESSSVSSDDSDGDESMEDVGFADEEGLSAGPSTGNLLNDPTANKKSALDRFVPAKIADKGPSMSIIFLACVCCVPLALIIGLSVGLTVGRGDGPEPTKAPTPAAPITPPPMMSLTSAPTIAPGPGSAEVLRASVLTSEATTTIYREGILVEVAQGEEDTLLVQNGPPGNLELPSAYALVEFDGIVGIDSSASTVEEYLSSITNATVDFCLTLAGNDDTTANRVTYSTCLLPPDSAPAAIDSLTGTSAPEYTIPGDCLNDEVVTFTVDPFLPEVCVDVTKLLLTNSSDVPVVNATTTDSNPALRGRRRAEETGGTGIDAKYLFIVDTLEESDQPGVRFYSSKATEGSPPQLAMTGDNTCITAAETICNVGAFNTLCSLVQKAGLYDALDSDSPFASRTLFAPLDLAVDFLATDIVEALEDQDVLIDTLKYHIVDEKVMTTDLECFSPLDMANGGQTFTLCGINGEFWHVGKGVNPGAYAFPQNVGPDFPTCYGVVHAMNEVLVPADTETNATCISEDQSQTLVDLCALPEYSMFCSMLTAVGVVDLFSTSGLYTLFAPTNEAFETALANLGSQNIDITDQKLIASVVLQHVVSGAALSSEDIVCDSDITMASGFSYPNKITCEGDSIQIAGPDQSNVAGVVNADIVGCNFVLHSIDAVILPPINDAPPGGGGGDGGDGGDGPGNEYDPCGVCPAGLILSEPTVEIEIPDSVGLPSGGGAVTCGTADAFCQAGGCSPDTCAAFAEGISQVCGCKEPSNNIPDVLDESFSSLFTFADEAGLVETLITTQGITLFAPNNDAFSLLSESAPDVVANLQENEFLPHLTDLLLYHVLPKELTTSEITGEYPEETLNGETVTMKRNMNDKLLVNKIKFITADIQADNGIVHTIGNVLLPDWVGKTVVDVIGDNPELATINDFIIQANLAETLSGEGPFTVFAPTNTAVQESLAFLGGIPLDDGETIGSILNYHVVPGIYDSGAISDGLGLTTVLGGEIVFNVVGGTVTVNGSRISTTDKLANNGIVHFIDGVLLPPGLLTPPTGPVDPAEPVDPTAPVDPAAPVDPGLGIPSNSETPPTCSICTGESGFFVLNNPDALISIPEGITIPAIEESQVTCTLMEQACQFSACDAEACAAFAASDAKDICGCEL